MQYLMINILQAYQLVPDNNFVWCIKSKKDQYRDSEHNLAGKLMTLTLKRYNILTNYEKWNSMYT